MNNLSCDSWGITISRLITMRVFRRKEVIMAYKKPKVVAKSAPKRSFVAGCPTNTRSNTVSCNPSCRCSRCEINS